MSPVDDFSAYSGEEGGVQVIGEVHRVVIKETRRHEAPAAARISCALTQRAALSDIVAQTCDDCQQGWRGQRVAGHRQSSGEIHSSCCVLCITVDYPESPLTPCPAGS